MSGRTRIALAAAVAALCLAVGAAPASAGKLDQQQTSVETNFFGGVAGPPFTTGIVWSQTFTAGRTGLLDQVDLFLHRSTVATQPLIVEIRDVTAAALPRPGSTVLASGSLLPAQVPLLASRGFVPVTIGSPAPVSAGTRYAIVAYTSGSNGYGWWVKNGDVYAAGDPFGAFQVPPTGPWGLGVGPFDFAFKTYVAYPFDGFFSPVENDEVNLAKAGRSIPVKFSLGGDQGLEVLAAGYPRIVFTECNPGDEVEPFEETKTANNGLTYDPATDTYTYVWKTRKSWKGRCGTFTLKLDDGTEHTAEFRFK